MNIYDIDGRKIEASDVIANLPVTKQCKHVEELMKSNYVAISWEDTKQYQLSAGTYVIPFPDERNPYNGNDPRYPIKYRLFENYQPDCKDELHYSYDPEFQHPVMWLSRIPLVLITGDLTGWTEALKKTSWGYTGSPLHIAMFITDCINWLSDNYEDFGEVFGKGWYSVVDSDLAPSATINFESVDIMSGAGLIAQALDCEYHFDFARKEFRLGTISYGTKVTLKTGVNVGVADVSRTKKDFYNAFLVKGSTRNLSQPTSTGENVQVMERLMLNPEKYPDGIMYTDDEGNIIDRNQFLDLDVPMLMQELIFDDIYPTLELYLYNTRERMCWLLDKEGNKVPDENGELDPDDGNRYKVYSKWYTRLAYPIYETDDEGVKTLSKWEDYKLGAYSVFANVAQMEAHSDIHASFYLDLNFHNKYFTTRSTRYPGSDEYPNFIIRMMANGYTVTGYVQREYNGNRCYVYSEYGFGGDDDRDETNPDEMKGFANNIKVGDKIEFVFGVNPQQFPEEYVDGANSVIKGYSNPSITFIPNYEQDAENSLLIGQGDFEAVYYDKETKEHGDDDMSSEQWTAHEGDYRIVQKESGNFIIPTTHKGGIYPVAAAIPELTNNKATLLNIVVDDVYKLQAQQDLEMVAKRKIKLLRSDLNNYTLPTDPNYFEENNLRLHIGQHVEYDNGQDLAGGTSYVLDTHIIKIETQIDYPWEKEITIGNEKVKSAISTMKDQISTVIGGTFFNSGSSSGSGSGTGINSDQMQQIIANYGSQYFLSKTVDDEAQGLIGFLKGAWFGAKQWIIDATGSANLYNVTVNGILKAYNAIINTVRSTGYSGDGMLDTGWRITDAYQGRNSKATFDFLYVRKKALFEELELRKISHIGGDFALSPASGRAYRVEYYDENGDMLGMDEMTVPYMLGYRLLMLFSKSKANKYLGRRKLIQRPLTDEEKLLVKRVRVYLFSDDGTTKTMSNWTVGAQARCQTFNIEEQMEYHGSGEDSDNPDVGFWTGKKVQNTYWWRLVSSVGKGTLSDGKTHDYIEFLANTGNDYDVADTGSDLPAAGDEFAQFGHRTRRELQNVVMIETAREDSPAIKLYTGINSWDLTGKRVSCISPEMTEFTANRFKLTTDYNGDVALNDRGLWIDIPQERVLVELPDTFRDDVRKCYYNDIVSHDGKWWVCTLASGVHKEDEDGHWYTQEELDWLMIHDMEKYASLVEKENYTALEPGDATLQQQSVWMVKEDYLVQVAHLELSNSMFVGSGQFTSTVTLRVSNVPATIDSVTVEDSYNEVTWNGSQLVCNASGSNPNRKVKVTAHGILNNLTYTASDVVCVYQLASSYTISATPNAFSFAQNENYPYSMNIDGVESYEVESEGETTEVLGNSCTQFKVIGDGVEQPFRITGVTCVGYSDDAQTHQEPGISCSYNNVTGRAWFVLVSNKMVKGKMTVTITYGNGLTQNVDVPFASSLNGTWVTEIENDVKTDVATKMTFDICDETGQVIKTTTLAEFTRSSSEDSAVLTKTTEYQAGQLAGTNASGLNTKIVNTNSRVSTAEGNINTISQTVTSQGQQITYTNQRIDTAEGSIQTISNDLGKTNKRVDTAEGSIQTVSDNLTNNYSTTIQTSNMISNAVSGLATTGYVDITSNNVRLGVISDIENEIVNNTGINIKTGEINMTANYIKCNPSGGSETVAIQIGNGDSYPHSALSRSRISVWNANMYQSGILGAGSEGGFMKVTDNYNSTYAEVQIYIDKGQPRITLRRGTSYGLSIMVNSSNKVIIVPLHGTNGWPTEGVDNISALPSGAVYLRSDSCLGVKR